MTFCKSQHYGSCKHFQLLAQPQKAPTTQRGERENRRRSIRRVLSTPFRFSEISDLKKTSTYLEEKAITVDLSSHGLCFSCDRLLQPDTMIYYAVEGENKRDLAHGLGRVIWSKQVENQPLFHIGVDFSSHSPQLEHH